MTGANWLVMIPTVRMGIKDFMVKYTMTPNTSSFDLTIQGHSKTGGCSGDVVTTPQSSVLSQTALISRGTPRE